MPMQSRTDQVHSYQFFLHRVISGLVARESDPAELPFRRLGWSAFGSIMVMVLVAAGFGVYGLYVGGGATSWQDGRSVIVEKESRTPYIYNVVEERLYPMANIISAKLALGTNARVLQVTARSLAGVPRGPLLGIPGAPSGLPENRQLVRGDWTFCSQQEDDRRGGEVTFSVLGVSRAPDRGQPIGERALLVEDAGTGQPQLVWHGYRFNLDTIEPQARQPLGLGSERVVPVAPAWLESLPVGDPLTPPEVSDRGQPVEWLDPDLEVLTGQVIAANRTYYLVQPDGLDQITAFQRDIVLADSATRSAYPGTDPYLREDVLSPALTGVSVRALPRRGASSPPQVVPELVSLGGQDAEDAAVCAVFAPGRDGFVPEVWAGARLPWARGNATPAVTEEGARLADYTVATGGRAVMVQTLAGPDAPGGSWFIVTDQGVRYGLASPEIAGMLGFELDRSVQLPGGLLARLPAGPALSPAAAVLPVVREEPADPEP